MASPEAASTSIGRRDFLATSGLALLTATVGSSTTQGQERTVSVQQLAREVMPANVRIFVHGEGGAGSGSGTLVNTPASFESLLEPDEVLVVSAGHVYHDSNEHTRLEVQIFEDFNTARMQFAKHTACEARCIGYRSEVAEGKQPPDVAILAVKLPSELRSSIKTVDLGAKDQNYEFGKQAVTVGCPGGKEPVWLNGRVLSFSEQSEKHPANIITIAYPQKGHSGGGLFDTNGQLVGVCSGSNEVPRGTIDFPVPAMMEKEVIVSSHPFKVSENQVVLRSLAELKAYEKRMTPDWAEFATGRGSFVSVPDVHRYLETLSDEYDSARQKLASLEKSYERLSTQLNKQESSLPAKSFGQLKSDLQSLAEKAIEEAKKEVSHYRPMQ
jgi:S1-C subfamily serine protease